MNRSFLLTLLISLLLASSSLFAANYYVSSSAGDDSRSPSQAQDPSTPWRTIAKLNTVLSTLHPGDAVFFRRGDVFDGSLTITASGTTGSPIVFGAYGEGEKPVINGLTTLKRWRPVGGNVWESEVPEETGVINLLLVNGTIQPLGRFPNTGYLSIESAGGKSSITSKALSSAPNFTGGDVVIRKARWIVDRNRISSHNGSNLQYTSASDYGASAGYGFFVENHRSTLDRVGEWYAQDGKIGVYFDGSPENYRIEASTVPALVSAYNVRHLVFENLSFAGGNMAFAIRNANNVAVRSCTIAAIGENAIDAANVTGLTIESNTINGTNNIALNLTSTNEVNIRNNNIQNTATIAGMGKSGDGTYEGILFSGNNAVIEGNSIVNTGYTPITFNGSSITIRNNFINNFNLVKDDGGGIYTWNNSYNPPAYTDRHITNNIILNGHSVGEGTDNADKKFSHGIYIDDNAANVEVSGNTVANCEGFGVYVHNANSNRIERNTAYNNTVQLVLIQDDIAPHSPIRNTVVSNNVLFSLQPWQLVAEYKSNADDVASFGDLNGNYYCRPFDDNATIGILKKANGNYNYQVTDVEGWKALYGKDANASASPRRFVPYNVKGTAGSNAFSNGSFSSNIAGLYAYSPANNCQTSWRNGPLDGGSLAVNFSSITNSSKGTVIIGVGPLTAGKDYLLRFSLKGGNEQKMLEIYLRKSGAPYNDVTERKLVKINPSRKEIEVLFRVSESTPDGSIGIDVPEQNSTVYFDNVDLREAVANLINPADSINFIYNATLSSATTPLSIAYTDVQANSYNGSITVAPFSSAVLMATGRTISNPPQLACSATGTILSELWSDITGNDVVQIPVNATPSTTSQLTAFERSPNSGNNYGARLRGYLCPPQTGTYTFFVAGDDGVELWLSTDSTVAKKSKIAYNLSWTDFREWNRNATQKSAGIYLEAGKKYYVEALQKEGGGGDHLSVAWQLPDGTFEGPITGSQLSPYVPAPTTVAQCSATGTILLEQWNGIDGNDVVQIPQGSAPSVSTQINQMERAENTGDRYGSRLSGYLCPPQTGSYVFWIAGDDGTELWLSRSDDPATKTKIAYSLAWTSYREWNRYASQRSVPIVLEAGGKYYIEALQKEGGGGDHLSVAWQLPDGTVEAPIGGNRLSSYQVTQQAATARTSSQVSTTIVSAPDGSRVLAAFPNPFSAQTTIEFLPSTSGHARLDVLNATGSTIARLYDGLVQKGAKLRRSFDAKNFPRGVYFVRCQSGDEAAVIRLIKE